MIDQLRITEDWIDEVTRTHKADPILTEKVIRAFLLLEGLVKQDMPFVFKGGTALMLHFDSTKRLSIDIDIILSDKQHNLDESLSVLVKEQGFTRYELQKRNTQSDIEKAHYKLFYKPARASAGEEEYVLLDILFEKPVRRVRIWGESAKLEAIQKHLFHPLIFPANLEAQWMAIDDLKD